MEDKRQGRGAITRRRALKELGVAGLGMTALGTGVEGLLAQAAAASPRTGSLKDIEHVVILMQENRSFDHYFGTLSGVRGFGDKRGRSAFTQHGLSGTTLQPYRLPQQCFPDITHAWDRQHQSWNGGRMDGFLRAHQEADGAAVAVETMGYYKRADIGFYYALADAFTVCDGYYCSVLGPTDPNRLMSMSGTLDPAGAHGGPLLETLTAGRTNRFTWQTMPESLDAHSVSWKVYTSPVAGILDNVLTYFKQYSPGSKLAARGITPTYPADFQSDLAHNRLPQVSWVLANGLLTEHPLFSSATAGEVVVSQLLQMLVSHPEIWKRTALFITWDENGGFVDHVAPPTPPKGTRGEFVTVSQLPPAAGGIRGPIGLGFRVPMLVVSPFSRGGLVCSDTFDHTSTLRFLETRFGAEVPNLSSWRRRVTGDLTSAFNFAAKPNVTAPRLPSPSGPDQNGCLGTPDFGKLVHVTSQGIPRQEPGKRRRPSGIVRRTRGLG